MEGNTNNVIYSNGIIIFNVHPEEGVSLKLNIKAGELFELAKHNIILLRIEWQENLTEYRLQSILETFSFRETQEGKIYQFQFLEGGSFSATTDDYPTRQ